MLVVVMMVAEVEAFDSPVVLAVAAAVVANAVSVDVCL